MKLYHTGKIVSRTVDRAFAFFLFLPPKTVDGTAFLWKFTGMDKQGFSAKKQARISAPASDQIVQRYASIWERRKSTVTWYNSLIFMEVFSAKRNA